MLRQLLRLRRLVVGLTQTEGRIVVCFKNEAGPKKKKCTIAEAAVHFSLIGASEKLPSAGSANDYLDFA